MAQQELLRLVPQAQPALARLLDGTRGPIEPAIRSEIFGPQRFAQHGRSLGETHRAGKAGVYGGTFSPRLRSNIQTLREAHEYIGVQAATGYDISPAAEWLLDNFHLIEAQLEEVHKGLPRRYFRSLPVLIDEPLAGLPRVYGIAWAFVAHTDGAFDEDLLVQFLVAYQETRELNLAEMWALPTTLRVVLIENLRRLAERVGANKAAREVANLCSDRIDTCNVELLESVRNLLDQRGVGRTFLGQMAQRLQDNFTTGPGTQGHHAQQLDWLKDALPDTAALQAQQTADQAADNLSVSNAVTALRAIGDAHWPDIVSRASALMRLMLTSPAFEAEDTSTRDLTLHGIERLARKSGRSELTVAQSLLDLMSTADPDDPHADPQRESLRLQSDSSDPAASFDLPLPAAGLDTTPGTTAVAGHWLQGPGRPALLRALGLRPSFGQPWRMRLKPLALTAYLGAVLLMTLVIVAWTLLRHGSGDYTGMAGLWFALALMVLPASEAAVAVINRLVSESVHPTYLPRLALPHGIPIDHRVMVVVPALLTDAKSIDTLVHRLLLHHLANPERHAQFALLSDWADASLARTPADDVLLEHARSRIQDINARYGVPLPSALLGPVPGASDDAAAPRFLLLHRDRRFSHSEQRWIGWERKRGKLEQLVAVLAQGTQDNDPFLDLGAESRIAGDTRYVVTLDGDTELPPGQLRALVGVAAHPRNEPRLSRDGKRVASGWGILQPRVMTPLPAPKQFTLFHWLFAGRCGIDPYSAATSEVYQDLFDEGSFAGKGLLHVAAVHAVLGNRLPDEQVLSHDLLEGSIARCAAVTNITVIEEAPFHADVAASRVHRWTRGDWQLLPFLLRSWTWRLRPIHAWKLFDNLRRSLVAPASVALLLVALSGRLVSPWAALALVFAAFSAGPVMGAIAGFVPSRADLAKRHFYRLALADLARAVWTGVWHVTTGLQQSIAALDAIGRALWRQIVSRRSLLEWTTAAAAQAQARTDLQGVLRSHVDVPIVAALLLGGLYLVGSPHLGLALALCALWAASPIWTWWVSRPMLAQREAAMPAVDRAYLQGIARDTWQFFERCVGPDDNHLPPDNLQTAPYDLVAHRTSPTNMGLYLLVVCCAREFGWIDTGSLLLRLEATMTTLDRLQRHRGHFLNWYDTQSCAPLLPMYVSTVDSGNLSGHLLAVAEACRALARAEASDDAQRERLAALADRCEAMGWSADYSFLYNKRRHLFHIGYRVAEQELDAGFYDLLASESRLTSLLAIAKGDVPVSHWAALGRPFFAVGADAGLRSWSGSMFEYLMPTLVLDEPHGSVLDQAVRAAVQEQINFGKAKQVPWGISESAYAASDHTLAYQYAPQGVPRLSLRRTPPGELVIAPYATGLAAQVMPHRACLNFAALDALAARGAYGFIEALDYSPARQTDTAPFRPVATYMSHHQGMTIVSLANVLLGGIARRWGMGNPRLEAVASLLHERAPREVPALRMLPSQAPPSSQANRPPGLLREVLPGATALEPTHVLGNGRYSVTLRANGAGWSRWGTVGITRWRDDALRDACGSFFYLRWAQQPQPVSITQHPAPDPAAHYRSVYHADRVCFDAAWAEVQAHTTVWVSPEDDIEFRQVEIRNLSDRELDIELMSAFEATLADPRADEAHPAFSNLFVTAEWSAADEALLLSRKPRLATETGLHAAHFLAEKDAQAVAVRVQPDRARWLGRNHDPSRPLAEFAPLEVAAVNADAAIEPASTDPAATPGLRLDTGLDPMCAISVKLRIAPRGKAQLTFATAASDNRSVLDAVIDKYRQPSHAQRASLMSATLAGIRLRSLGIGAEPLAAIQTLTSALVHSLTRPQSSAERGTARSSGAALDALDANLATAPAAVTAAPGPVPCDRRLLWRFGISGDRPIVLVSAGVMQDVGMLRSLAQALRLWAWGGIACDLVVVNAEPASYLMTLQREANALRERHAAETAAQPGAATTAMHVLRAGELSAVELSTLNSLARLRLHADGRPLMHHVQAWTELHEEAFDERLVTSTAVVKRAALADTGVSAPQGQFAASTGEYRFGVSALHRPQKPWINVLSNPVFGAQLSEAGGGYTWALNSRMNQLTAWSNDPVADPACEWFLLQERKTRTVWSVTPSAIGGASGTDGAPLEYRVAHGQGYSVVSHRRGDLDVTTTWCVDPATSVKQVRIRLVNRGHRSLSLRVVGIVEWMMGANRSDRATVHTAPWRQRLPDAKLHALLATQRDHSAGFGEGTAFLALASSQDDPGDWTCDRRECFDARGRLVLPDHFGQRSGSGLDPCAAISTTLALAAGEGAEKTFLIGYAADPPAARQLAAEAAAAPSLDRLDRARDHWTQLLGATRVKTPDADFDAMVNHWLLYQTVACRIWAKAGFYQAGGAIGFRDQLQDSMALAWTAPRMLREQIVLAASRQFEAGDVQHWWHMPGGAGVRTHFSDDLLWLPHALSHYLATSGDRSLLDAQVPFLEGAEIPPGAEDAYFTPTVGSVEASVYEHAARTIDRSLRVGTHGLPLMGTGDWNDGMNRVGHEGRGESVWLGWFLYRVVHDFAPIAIDRGDGERAERWLSAARQWQAALLGQAWDGQWFKRAFFDNGEPLGSSQNTEARIDLIAQAWAVLSGAAPLALQRIALAAVEDHLVDKQAGLLKLLDPPLAHAEPSAGYIQAYPKGVRENGGQYSHGAVWALMAQARYAVNTPDASTAAIDTAYRYFTYLSPAHRSRHPTHGQAYAIEPYVMAGDVYTQPPYVGRGGWSWYTGSAAWMHRAAIESIFGLHLADHELCFQPCLPSAWPHAELTLEREGRSMHFVFVRSDAASAMAQAAPILERNFATLLLPEQRLDWQALAPKTNFVVPLL